MMKELAHLSSNSTLLYPFSQMQAPLKYIVPFLDVFYLQLFPFTCPQYDMLGDSVESR